MRERVRQAPPASNDLTELQKAVARVNAGWYISLTLPPPAPGAPLTWRITYTVKRIAHRIMAELLNTIVQQQNTFNREVARTLTELAAQESRLADLEARLAQLEQERKQ